MPSSRQGPLKAPVSYESCDEKRKSEACGAAMPPEALAQSVEWNARERNSDLDIAKPALHAPAA